MSSFFEAVTDVVEDVGEAVGDVVEAGGDVVSDVGDAVGDVASGVVDAVSDTVEKVGDVVTGIIEDPKKLAAVAIAVAFPGAGAFVGESLLGAEMAAALGATATQVIGQTVINTAINGGDIEQGLMTAGVSVMTPALAKEIAGTAIEQGVDKTIANAGAKVAAGTISAAALGQDPLTAFTFGAIDQAANAVLSSATSDPAIKSKYDALPDPAKVAVVASITSALTGADPSTVAANMIVQRAIASASQAVNQQDARQYTKDKLAENGISLTDSELDRIASNMTDREQATQVVDRLTTKTTNEDQIVKFLQDNGVNPTPELVASFAKELGVKLNEPIEYDNIIRDPNMVYAGGTESNTPRWLNLSQNERITGSSQDEEGNQRIDIVATNPNDPSKTMTYTATYDAVTGDVSYEYAYMDQEDPAKGVTVISSQTPPTFPSEETAQPQSVDENFGEYVPSVDLGGTGTTSGGTTSEGAAGSQTSGEAGAETTGGTTTGGATDGSIGGTEGGTGGGLPGGITDGTTGGTTGGEGTTGGTTGETTGGTTGETAGGTTGGTEGETTGGTSGGTGSGTGGGTDYSAQLEALNRQLEEQRLAAEEAKAAEEAYKAEQAAKAATAAQNARNMAWSSGLAGLSGLLPTTAAPIIDESVPQAKAEFLTSKTGDTKFQSPLAQFQQKVEGVDEFPDNQPIAQEKEMNPYYSYGNETPVEAILGLGGDQQVNPTEDKAYFMAAGGMATPLMAAQGGFTGTRHGKYAKGGVSASPLVAAGGKMRVDFRHGDAVSGAGDGQSDDIPAMLADGEFVFPADVVAAIGNGSTKAGSDKLYDMMHNIRAHVRSAKPKELPPEIKSPLDFLKTSKKRSA